MKIEFLIGNQKMLNTPDCTYFKRSFSIIAIKEVSLYICFRSIKWQQAGVNRIVNIHAVGILVTFQRHTRDKARSSQGSAECFFLSLSFDEQLLCA